MQNTQIAGRDLSFSIVKNAGNSQKKMVTIGETGCVCRVKGRNKADKRGSSAEKILKAFNTWAFKREQPAGAERLAGLVADAAVTGQPLSFVLYWGKGPRHAVAAPDLACLDYLKSMADRIAEVHPAGADIRLILTDTHARLNGHAQSAIDGYFAGVDAAAQERGFTTARLSDIVAFAREVVDLASEEMPSDDVLRNLVACAQKWYRGEGSTEQGALEYHRMNMVERRAVEVAFPASVFVTFNNGEFRDLFPATMPIFYMYSLRRGVGVKPWFMAEEADVKANGGEARSDTCDAASMG